MEIINDGQWINGLDSISYTLGQGSYVWGQNIVNRGGILETRQGFAEVAAVQQRDPRGLGIITHGGVTYLMAAIGDLIYYLNINNPAGLVPIPRLSCPIPDYPSPIPTEKRMVHFELCVQTQKSVKQTDGKYIITQITPKFVVIIQDGFSPAQFWDPSETVAEKKSGPVNEHPDYRDSAPTPIGTFMKWVGDRLWIVTQGKKVRASNLLNPFQFTDEAITASGGAFFLPDTATGLGVTHDYKALLAFTHFTTTAIQVGIEQREQWPSTQDFQRVIFPSIGCASHRTIINMYGMTWWMSHEGLVGLDNAMAAYQTTRLDIKDLNMIRSKAGINWSNGGGASGSFGNFLFFSVPSASKWNQHTWVLDQSPISLLAGSSPPSWCANWTGIRPEQWITCQVGGRQRCFFISRDLTNEGHQSTVWEAFIGQRMDVPKVGNDRRAKDIGCAFESRFLGLSPSQYCKLRWIELDVAEIIGDVALRVYYCGRRTSYKQIINTHLTSTVSSSTEEIFNPDDPIPVNVPQYRTVRSVTDGHTTTDNDSEVQTPYLRNKDREFSVLVQWSGQMAVSGVRLAVDPEPDYMEGTDYPDEYLKRTITAEGSGDIGCTLPPVNAPNGQLTSQYLSPTKPRWVEFPSYDSAVPNGVFFVAELFATPPPNDYPLNTYPITVNFASETEGIDIYWTLDGTIPREPPNVNGTHYGAGHHPVVQLNQTLKAKGFRQGLGPSPLFTGRYTQSKVADVIYNPPAGGYPPETFAQNAPPYTGPIVGYNMNEGTGTVVGDSSPNNIDGATHNTIWNATGKHGKAINFNGSSGYVSVALATASPLKFSGSMTLSAWVNISAFPPIGQTNFIVGRADNIGGWSIYTDFGMHACVSVAGAINTFAVRASTTVLVQNTWRHITGVYNAAARTLDIYVDGVLSNGTLTGTVPPAPQLLRPVNVAIGRRGDGTCFFHGILDDVRIYNRVLTQAEITQDMNNGVAPPPPPPVGFPVLMSCATAGAAIHFVTTTGSNQHNVTSSDPTYAPATPPHPHVGDTLRAKAFKQFYLDSDQTNGRYFAKPRCQTPTCTPDGGVYPGGDYPKSIAIASGTTGSQLRVTINDADVVHGTVKPNPTHVSVNIDDTLRVISQKEDFSDSLVKTATYTKRPEQVAIPVLDPSGATLSGNHHEQDVHIVCSTTGVSMRWKVGYPDDLSPPTLSDNILSTNDAHIHLGPDQPTRIGHKILKVIAYRADMTDSVMATGLYEYDGEGDN